ncbi:39_t:CDS:2 [Paraglomus occultum]|uniref:39_t:CDS:1 n=1 Tax=Paraglomus occultum TaxID=144539 RepID=A0A9N8WR88_9GLOM|nr:39_t:CDS:2 [Paraglomus occultum]
MVDEVTEQQNNWLSYIDFNADSGTSPYYSRRLTLHSSDSIGPNSSTHTSTTALPARSVPTHPLTHQRPLFRLDRSQPHINNHSTLQCNYCRRLLPSPLSFLEYSENAPTSTEELDTPEFFQHSKEKYESAKSEVKRQKRRGEYRSAIKASISHGQPDNPSLTLPAILRQIIR